MFRDDKQNVKSASPSRTKKSIIEEWVHEYCQEHKLEEVDPALLNVNSRESSMLPDAIKPLFIRKFNDVSDHYKHLLETEEQRNAVAADLCQELEILKAQAKKSDLEHKRDNPIEQEQWKYTVCLRALQNASGHLYPNWLLSPKLYEDHYQDFLPRFYNTPHNIRALLAAYWLAASDPELGKSVLFSQEIAGSLKSELETNRKRAEEAGKPFDEKEEYEALRKKYIQASKEAFFATIFDIQRAHNEDKEERKADPHNDYRSCLPGTVGRLLRNAASYNALAAVTQPAHRYIPEEIENFIIEKLKKADITVIAALYRIFFNAIACFETPEEKDLEIINPYVTALLSDEGINELAKTLTHKYSSLNLDTNKPAVKSRLIELMHSTIYALIDVETFTKAPPTPHYNEFINHFFDSKKAELAKIIQEDPTIGSYRVAIFSETPALTAIERLIENEIFKGLLDSTYLTVQSIELSAKLKRYSKEINTIRDHMNQKYQELIQMFSGKYAGIFDIDTNIAAIATITQRLEIFQQFITKLDKQTEYLTKLNETVEAVSFTTTSASDTTSSASSFETRESLQEKLLDTLSEKHYLINQKAQPEHELKNQFSPKKPDLSNSPEQWALAFARLAFQFDRQSGIMIENHQELAQLSHLMQIKFTEKRDYSKFREKVIEALNQYCASYENATVNNIDYIKMIAIKNLNVIFDNQINPFISSLEKIDEIILKNIIKYLHFKEDKVIIKLNDPKAKLDPVIALSKRIDSAQKILKEIHAFIENNSLKISFNPRQKASYLGKNSQKLVDLLLRLFNLDPREYTYNFTRSSKENGLFEVIHQIYTLILMKALNIQQLKTEDAAGLLRLLSNRIKTYNIMDSRFLGIDLNHAFMDLSKIITLLHPLKTFYQAGFVYIANKDTAKQLLLQHPKSKQNSPCVLYISTEYPSSVSFLPSPEEKPISIENIKETKPYQLQKLQYQFGQSQTLPGQTATYYIAPTIVDNSFDNLYILTATQLEAFIKSKAIDGTSLMPVSNKHMDFFALAETNKTELSPIQTSTKALDIETVSPASEETKVESKEHSPDSVTTTILLPLREPDEYMLADLERILNLNNDTQINVALNAYQSSSQTTTTAPTPQMLYANQLLESAKKEVRRFRTTYLETKKEQQPALIAQFITQLLAKEKGTVWGMFDTNEGTQMYQKIIDTLNTLDTTSKKTTEQRVFKEMSIQVTREYRLHQPVTSQSIFKKEGSLSKSENKPKPDDSDKCLIM